MLLMRRAVTRGYCVRSTDPRAQLREVIERFDLSGAVRPFTRCLRCHAPLETVPKADVQDRLPPRVRERCTAFARCPACDRVSRST
jgi:hypothetical protein